MIDVSFLRNDLRRSCRILLSKKGTLGRIDEHSLNHKLKGVKVIDD
jgi:hypothetical protein